MRIPDLTGMRTTKGIVVGVRPSRSKVFPLTLDVFEGGAVTAYAGRKALDILDVGATPKNAGILTDALVAVMEEKGVTLVGCPVTRVSGGTFGAENIPSRVFLMCMYRDELRPVLVWDLPYTMSYSDSLLHVLMKEYRSDKLNITRDGHPPAVLGEDYDAWVKGGRKTAYVIVNHPWPGAKGRSYVPVDPEKRAETVTRLRQQGYDAR